MLQAYYEQPLKKPLPDFERKLLRGAVNITLKDGGTPFDAANRFYAAYAETHIGRGGNLNDIRWGGVMGRMFAIRGKFKHYEECTAQLKLVSQMEKDRKAPAYSISLIGK